MFTVSKMCKHPMTYHMPGHTRHLRDTIDAISRRRVLRLARQRDIAITVVFIMLCLFLRRYEMLLVCYECFVIASYEMLKLQQAYTHECIRLFVKSSHEVHFIKMYA